MHGTAISNGATGRAIPGTGRAAMPQHEIPCSHGLPGDHENRERCADDRRRHHGAGDIRPDAVPESRRVQSARRDRPDSHVTGHARVPGAACCGGRDQNHHAGQRPETARNQPTPERPDHRAARQHCIRRRSPHRVAAATAGSSSSGSRASAESTAPIMPTASGIADASGS